MKALIQRVSSASVRVEGKIVGDIGVGLLLFIGVGREDDRAKADTLLSKVLAYRIFAETDKDGKVRMNRSLADTGGGLLIVSQFTLVAETDKGLRPGFSSAASPADAEALYNYFVEQACARHPVVASGVFAADMQVALVNDGPVTFLLEN
ncbi:MAG: D-tyrosyl-tRNA(Tyr) deacylase [Porticoccaceae bacterium]|nr:D-tyrosyl-tRNA(Tyr) deacylase [Porticoccaceae bacterium]